MQRHNESALTIATWLNEHDAVAEVFHPGLTTHPANELAKRQFLGFGGTFSFRLKDGQDAALRFLGRVKLFTLAESLGGVESLIEHPCSMTHASMTEAAREASGITPDLVRISIGLEHPTDLIADLDAALGAP
jgi:cystathionine beta-lyase/cystathionine gamma-synthase